MKKCSIEFKLILHCSFQYFFLAMEIYTTVLDRLYRTIDYKVFQLITNLPFMAVGNSNYICPEECSKIIRAE